jgi:type IV secretion system protein VirB8
MPLKTVEPYTLMVDKTTGYVQALKPLDQTKISPDSALTQSFLVQYVIAREGFDVATLNSNYRKVALFSADRARSSYLQTMQSSNPENPLATYPRSSVVDVQVKSVSPIGANAALVRFDAVRTDAGAQPAPPSPWVAIIRYRYSAAPMKLEDRFANPLGFQVVGYRKDAEAAPAAAAASAYYPSAPGSPGQFGAAR